MINVTVTDAADGTIHSKYGLLKKGSEIEIDEADFGEEIFKKKTVVNEKLKTDNLKGKEE
ncbi:MAG: hypothetical protein Q7U10_08800 [Thermodesulfovibrionia bacterium]|nr:hypothetical protein [Thermodesulfovibrionia bacterium]